MPNSFWKFAAIIDGEEWSSFWFRVTEICTAIRFYGDRWKRKLCERRNFTAEAEIDSASKIDFAVGVKKWGEVEDDAGVLADTIEVTFTVAGEIAVVNYTYTTTGNAEISSQFKMPIV